MVCCVKHCPYRISYGPMFVTNRSYIETAEWIKQFFCTEASPDYLFTDIYLFTQPIPLIL